MSEYSFVQKFLAAYVTSNGNGSAIQAPGKNQSTYADCEIVFQGTLVKLECKLLKDTRSNSRNFYNMLGETIGTSAKPSLLEKSGGMYPCVKNGFLIPANSENTFASLWQKNVTAKNGNSYSRDFNVVYLVLFNSASKQYVIKQYDTNNNSWV
jgi:hypothetical protein